jgi:hypothetical protein
MAIEVESRWGEGRRNAGRILLATLRVMGHTMRLVTFSVLILLAPIIRVVLVLGALGILFVCLVQLGVSHRHPFPYAQGITIAIVCAVLRVLFDRLLIALAPDGTTPTLEGAWGLVRAPPSPVGQKRLPCPPSACPSDGAGPDGGVTSGSAMATACGSPA